MNWFKINNHWINIALMREFYIRKTIEDPVQYNVFAIDINDNDYEIFKQYFTSFEDAQEFLNNFMIKVTEKTND